VFSGCKINRMRSPCRRPACATIGFDFLGKDITTAGAEYFTSPTAETTTGIMLRLNGIVAQGSGDRYAHRPAVHLTAA
jgi:hypothetical protein